jgi:hypothetical protein
MLDPSIPNSDDWWVIKLGTAMGLGFPRLGELKSYREGDAPIGDEDVASMKEAYRKWARTSRLVMTDLIVVARTSRQKPVGFRTASAGDDLGDTAAWDNWNRSHMKVQSRDFLNDVGHYGTAYITVVGSAELGVGPAFEGQRDEPIMVPSNEWTSYSQQYKSMPWLTEAFIHVGYDSVIGADTITLHRPGYIRTCVLTTAESTVPNNGDVWVPNRGYVWEGGPVSLGFTDAVNVARMDAPDRVGFYEKHTDTIDRINETIKQRATIIAMQAFRQRAIKGDLPTVYPADHEKAGETIDYNEIFKAGPAALWMIPEGADIWESAVTDITPILSAAKEDIKMLAAVTSTPLYVLSPDAAAGSAEGAALVKEMVSFSVEDLNERADSTFAVALSLAFEAQRDTTRADSSKIETIWQSIDRQSMLARAAAAPSAKAGGMPQRMIDEKIFGLTPAEISQARQDRQNDEFDAPATTDTTTPQELAPVVDPVVTEDPLAVPTIPAVGS